MVGICAINSVQLMGWPHSRRSKAAASRALFFLEAEALAGAGAGGDASFAGGFFFVGGVGVAGIRFFLAIIEQLLGRQLASFGGTPVAPPHQRRRTTSTAPPAPGNSEEIQKFRPAQPATVL